MKEFIYQLIDFMWFWTSDATRLAKFKDCDCGDNLYEVIYIMYLIATIAPIVIGTLFHYVLIDYLDSLPTVVVNNKSVIPTNKFIKNLIHTQVIENIIFWLIFNTLLLALPIGLSIVIFFIMLVYKGGSLCIDDASRFDLSFTYKYSINKLKKVAQKQVFNEIKKVQENYLNNEKQFLNDLSKYKNEGSSNLLQAGVN